MEKINNLVLLIHPLWNKFFFKEPDIKSPIKLVDLLKDTKFRRDAKAQITTYANTIKNIASRNKNTHIIIIFPGEEMFLNKFKSELKTDVYRQRTEEYWRILIKFFKTKLKKMKNIEISSYHPTLDIKQDEFLKKVSIRPEQLSKNLKIISFGEQYSKKKMFCVNVWTERIQKVLKKQKFNVELKIIEDATLKPKEEFKKKIKKLQKKKLPRK